VPVRLTVEVLGLRVSWVPELSQSPATFQVDVFRFKVCEPELVVGIRPVSAARVTVPLPELKVTLPIAEESLPRVILEEVKFLLLRVKVVLKPESA